MKYNLNISGFADEISADFITQLETVQRLGMQYISLRSANGKGIAEYTVKEVEEQLLPLLNKFGIKVSSLGSPIGKIKADDEEGFQKQLVCLDQLCQIGKLLDCSYIRMFSFYLPEGKEATECKGLVWDKIEKFIAIAQKYNMVLIHENEKEIYGDIGERCLELMEAFAGPNFKSVFDFANFVQCKEDPKVCWEMLKPYIAYIHIKDAVSTDNENVVCGTGEGKIKEILTQAVQQEGYEGFLTLEPHLVLFDSLASLETTQADQVIKENKAKDGAEGYAMQYHALCQILDCL